MGVNIRALILDVLMEVTEGEAYSHIALRDTLEKYEYLDKRDRAFISRVTEGTLENLAPDPQSAPDVSLSAEMDGRGPGLGGCQ